MKYILILLSLIIFAFAATLVSGQSSRNAVLSDYGKLPLSISNAAGSQGLATGVAVSKTAGTITASVDSTSGTAQLTVTHHK